MLVHDDFRFFAGRAKTIANEIHFGLYDGEIILGPALQHKTGAQRCKIGNARNVEEDVLRQHGSEASKNFFRLPALALKIHDIRLHEDRAAIAKHGHSLRRESEVGKLVHIKPEILPPWIEGNIHFRRNIAYSA